MSIKLNHGGPAFPFVVDHGDKWQVFTGMTMRDYFAAQALAGLCADPRITAEAEQIAPVCYAFADAMLAAREERP